MISCNLCCACCCHQREEERQAKIERRKKERAKLLNEKRNLAGIVSDATKRAEDFERQVSLRLLSGFCPVLLLSIDL